MLSFRLADFLVGGLRTKLLVLIEVPSILSNITILSADMGQEGILDEIKWMRLNLL